MASVELLGNPTWPKTLRPICVLSRRCWRTVSRSLSSVRRVTAMPCMAGISIIYLLRACYEEMRTAPSDFSNGIPHRTSLQEAHQNSPRAKRTTTAENRGVRECLWLFYAKHDRLQAIANQYLVQIPRRGKDFSRAVFGRTLPPAAFGIAYVNILTMRFQKPTRISIEPRGGNQGRRAGAWRSPSPGCSS